MALAGTLAVLFACTTMASGTVPGGERKSAAERAADTNTQLALGYLRQGRLEAARDTINKALAQYPRTAETQMAAGLVYEQLKEDRKARSFYEEAARLAKDNPDVMNNVAVYYCRNGERKRGEQYFLKAATSPLYHTPEVAYTNAGRCAREDGRPGEAEQYLRKALSIKPGQPDALLQMAQLTHEAGNELQARAFLQRYFAVGPVTSATLWLGNRIEMALGDTAQANDYARRLKTEFPTSEETGLLLNAERGTP